MNNELKPCPFPSEDAKRCGWCVDFKFIGSLREAALRHSEDVSMEAIDAVILELHRMGHLIIEEQNARTPSPSISQVIEKAALDIKALLRSDFIIADKVDIGIKEILTRNFSNTTEEPNITSLEGRKEV